MKYDANNVFRQAREQGKARRLNEPCDPSGYCDCRYKTAEEINEELKRERLRDLGEAIGCFAAVVLGSVAMYLFLCL